MQGKIKKEMHPTESNGSNNQCTICLITLSLQCLTKDFSTVPFKLKKKDDC